MTGVPDLSAGQCVTGRGGLPPDVWSSDDPADRKAALHACRSCPVLERCAGWAVTAPGMSAFTGVVGGMMGRAQLEAGRKRRRRGAEINGEQPAA